VSKRAVTWSSGFEVDPKLRHATMGAKCHWRSWTTLRPPVDLAALPFAGLPPTLQGVPVCEVGIQSLRFETRHPGCLAGTAEVPHSVDAHKQMDSQHMTHQFRKAVCDEPPAK
jgi:hypothetical protein